MLASLVYATWHFGAADTTALRNVSLLLGTCLLLVGGCLLLLPAYRLYRNPTRAGAMALFNRASYYPMALLMVVLLKLVTTA